MSGIMSARLSIWMAASHARTNRCSGAKHPTTSSEPNIYINGGTYTTRAAERLAAAVSSSAGTRSNATDCQFSCGMSNHFAVAPAEVPTKKSTYLFGFQLYQVVHRQSFDDLMDTSFYLGCMYIIER